MTGKELRIKEGVLRAALISGMAHTLSREDCRLIAA